MPGLVPACVDDGLKWKLQMCWPVSLAGAEAYIYTRNSAWRCRAAQMEFPAQAVGRTLNTHTQTQHDTIYEGENAGLERRALTSSGRISPDFP